MTLHLYQCQSCPISATLIPISLVSYQSLPYRSQNDFFARKISLPIICVHRRIARTRTVECRSSFGDRPRAEEDDLETFVEIPENHYQYSTLSRSTEGLESMPCNFQHRWSVLIIFLPFLTIL